MTAPPPRHHTIFFDVGGTLLKARPSVGSIYAEIAAEHGIVVDPRDVERAARRVFGRNKARERAAGRSPHTIALGPAREFWREVVRESFGPAGLAPRFDEFFARVFDEFALPARYEPFPEVERVLARLRAAGRRVGVLSNWDARLRPVLAGLEFCAGFDPVIISAEAGAEKPDPRIFEIARAAAGAGPGDRLLHVGDSHEDDYLGATAAGFEARLVRRDLGQTLEDALADLL